MKAGDAVQLERGRDSRLLPRRGDLQQEELERRPSRFRCRKGNPPAFGSNLMCRLQKHSCSLSTPYNKTHNQDHHLPVIPHATQVPQAPQSITALWNSLAGPCTHCSGQPTTTQNQPTTPVDIVTETKPPKPLSQSPESHADACGGGILHGPCVLRQPVAELTDGGNIIKGNLLCHKLQCGCCITHMGGNGRHVTADKTAVWSQHTPINLGLLSLNLTSCSKCVVHC